MFRPKSTVAHTGLNIYACICNSGDICRTRRFKLAIPKAALGLGAEIRFPGHPRLILGDHDPAGMFSADRIGGRSCKAASSETSPPASTPATCHPTANGWNFCRLFQQGNHCCLNSSLSSKPTTPMMLRMCHCCCRSGTLLLWPVYQSGIRTLQ